MQISILLAQQIAQLFLILIMGYAVVKVGLLKASDSRVLSVVMVYLVTPCVIINAFQIDDTPEIRKGLLYSMAIAAAIHVVLLVLSALLSRPLKLDAVEQVNVIYSNAAALVIPLVKALMGDAYVIYSCAFIIVQLVLLWTHASSLLQGSSALDWKKVLTNINMIAIAAGALLYWFRVVLPAPLQNTMSTVGNMMGPMGMLLAGMAIAEKPLREVFCTRRNYLPTVLRLVVCPLVVLVLLWVCHASSWVAKEGGHADIDKAEKEVMAAIDAGVNYLDTAYVYAGNEAAVGEILARNHCRERIYLATKLPHYLIKSVEGAQKMFEEELRRLQTDYIDDGCLYFMESFQDIILLYCFPRF